MILFRYIAHAKARGASWVVETFHYACACGNQNVTVQTNRRNGDQLMCKHAAPDGSACPEISWQQGRERTRRICIAAGVTP